MEQKYQIGNDYGSIMWNIEKMLDDKHLFKIKEYDVAYLAMSNPFHGNDEYVKHTDITQPLIVVQLTENIDKVVDGNHRLQKALKLGMKIIHAYTLSFEEHCNYIVDYNEKTYRGVVEHWFEEISFPEHE